MNKLNLHFTITNEIKEILEILNNTNESVFITGAAGTGKSSLLNYFIKNTNKKYVVLAPTGIAALNIGDQTIHKSQGKTFDKIIIDIGRGAFAHGQVYVALSRCKSFNGIFLNNRITKKI